jgi:hypothetical protein
LLRIHLGLFGHNLRLRGGIGARILCESACARHQHRQYNHCGFIPGFIAHLPVSTFICLFSQTGHLWKSLDFFEAQLLRHRARKNKSCGAIASQLARHLVPI